MKRSTRNLSLSLAIAVGLAGSSIVAAFPGSSLVGGSKKEGKVNPYYEQISNKPEFLKDGRYANEALKAIEKDARLWGSILGKVCDLARLAEDYAKEIKNSPSLMEAAKSMKLLEDSLQVKVQVLKETSPELELAKTELGNAEDNLKHTEEELKGKQPEYNTKKKAKDDAAKALEDATAELKKATDAEDAAEKAVQENAGKKNAATTKLAQDEKAYNDAKKAYDDKMDEYNRADDTGKKAMQAEVDALKKAMEEKEAAKNATTAEIQKLAAEAQTLADAKTKATQEKTQAEAKKQEAQTKFDAAEGEFGTVETNYKAAQEEVKAAKETVKAAQQKIAAEQKKIEGKLEEKALVTLPAGTYILESDLKLLKSTLKDDQDALIPSYFTYESLVEAKKATVAKINGYQKDAKFVYENYRTSDLANKRLATVQGLYREAMGNINIIRAFAEKNGLSLAGARCAIPDGKIVKPEPKKTEKKTTTEKKDKVPNTGAALVR